VSNAVEQHFQKKPAITLELYNTLDVLSVLAGAYSNLPELVAIYEDAVLDFDSYRLVKNWLDLRLMDTDQ
jgi:hypothetical protein